MTEIFSLTEISSSYDLATDSIEVLCSHHQRSSRVDNCVERGSLFLSYSRSNTLQFTTHPIQLKSDFTFEGIYKIEGSSQNKITLFSDQTAISIYLENDLTISVQLLGNSNSVSITSEEIVTQGQYFQLSLKKNLYDIDLFLNGEKIKSTEIEFLLLNSNEMSSFIVDSSGWNMWMTEIRLFSKALDDITIAQHCFVELNSQWYWESLLIYYKLDESNSATLYDWAMGSKNKSSNITTSVSNMYGISWDTISTDIYICSPNSIKIGTQCFQKNRVLNFQNKVTQSIHTENYSLGNDFTIEFWAYTFSQPSDVQTILLEKQNHLAFILENNPDNDQELICIFIGNNGENNLDGDSQIESSPFEISMWHHFSVSNSRIVNICLFLLDGEVEIQTKAFEYTSLVSSPFCIGGNCENQIASSFNGYFRELRIFDSYKSQGTIRRNMHKTIDPKFELSLLGYFKLDEPSGSILYDYSECDKNTALPSSNPSLRISLLKSLVVCSEELIYDEASQSCGIPTHLLKMSESTTLTFPLNYPDLSDDDFTLEFWLYVKSNLSSWSIAYSNKCRIEIDGTGELSFLLLGTSSLMVDSTNPLNDNNWFRIKLSFSSQGMASYYVYNENKSSTVINQNKNVGEFSFTTPNPKQLIITNTNLEAFIHEIRIFSTYHDDQPNDSKLKYRMNPFGRIDLISYWRLDESKGNIIYDYSIFGSFYESSFEWRYIAEEVPFGCENPLYVLNDGICQRIDTSFSIYYGYSHHKVYCPSDSETCECYELGNKVCSDSPEGYILNPYNDIIFHLIDEIDTSPTYEWTIFPPLSYSVVSSNYIQIQSSQLERGKYYDIVCTKTPEFGYGDSYSRVVKLYIEQGMNEDVGEVYVTPLIGFGYATLFTVSAIGFEDLENGKLKYSFGYEVKGTTEVVWMSKGIESSHYDTKLPAGLSSQNYEIVIYARVYNQFNSFITSTISVTSNPKSISDKITYCEEQIQAFSSKSIPERIFGVSLILDIMGGSEYEEGICDNGIYDTQFSVCSCKAGYNGKDCSLSESENDELSQIKNLIYEEILSIISTEEISAYLTTDTGVLLLKNIQQCVQSINHNTYEFFLIMSEFIKNIVTTQITSQQNQNDPFNSTDPLLLLYGIPKDGIQILLESINTLIQQFSYHINYAKAFGETNYEIGEILNEISSYSPIIHNIISIENKNIIPGETSLYNMTYFTSLSYIIDTTTMEDSTIVLENLEDSSPLYISFPHGNLPIGDAICILSIVMWKNNLFESYTSEEYEIILGGLDIEIKGSLDLRNVEVKEMEYPLSIYYYVDQNFQFEKLKFCILMNLQKHSKIQELQFP